MAIVETFELASFDGIEFPWSEFSSKFSLDHFVHKYVHRPGGVVEDLGRHCYEWHFHSDFHETTLAQWAGKYPENLQKLVEVAESGATRTLIVPGIGPFQAKLIGLDRKFVAKVLSGEATDLTFLEDATELYSMQALFAFASVDLQSQVGIIREALNVLEPTFPPPTNVVPFVEKGPFDDLRALLDAIEAALNAVLLARDTAELELLSVSLVVAGLIAACAAFDALVQSPILAPAADANYEIWAAAIAMQNDLYQTAQTLDTYTTRREMSITEVALDIYGTSYAAPELMQLNALPDPFRIPDGTPIYHYPQPAVAA
jgi:hypothetical protein